jgi:hypothetical protein
VPFLHRFLETIPLDLLPDKWHIDGSKFSLLILLLIDSPKLLVYLSIRPIYQSSSRVQMVSVGYPQYRTKLGTEGGTDKLGEI